MTPTVYLAAPWVYKEAMKSVQDIWEAAGVVVTSHWIRYHPADDVDKDFVALAHEAIEDLKDVDAADTIVLYPLAKSEGKATELGYAYALGKRCIIVGEWNTNNVFFYLPGVQWAKDTATAIEMVLHP